MTDNETIWKVQHPTIELEYYNAIKISNYKNNNSTKTPSTNNNNNRRATTCRSSSKNNKRILKSVIHKATISNANNINTSKKNTYIVQSNEYDAYYTTADVVDDNNIVDSTNPQQASQTKLINNQLSRFSFVADDPLSCGFLRKYTKRTFCEENLNFFIAVKLFQSRYETIIKQEESLQKRRNIIISTKKTSPSTTTNGTTSSTTITSTNKKTGVYCVGDNTNVIDHTTTTPTTIQQQPRTSNISETSSVTSNDTNNTFIDTLLITNNKKGKNTLNDMVHMIWNRFCDNGSEVSIITYTHTYTHTNLFQNRNKLHYHIKRYKH